MRWGNQFLSWIRVRSYDYSRVTRVRVLLTFLTTSLRYLRILASLGVTWCDTPYFLAYPHVFLTCGPFIGFLGFFGVSQSYSCVGVDRHNDYSADSAASLAQCGFIGGYFPNFAIFVLVSDHLRNFCFYSWASLLVLPSLLRLPIILSLSPLVTSLGGQGCSPPSLVVPVVFALGEFISVAAVLCLLLPPPARGDVSSCWASLVCLFSLSWYTCGFYTLCHAAGCLSGVPLLVASGWLLYSCGDDFAWGWGLSCHSCPVPPLFSFLCLRCFPLGVLPPYRVGWHVCLQFAGLPFGVAGGGLLRLFPQCLCAVFPAAGTLGFLGFSCSACLLGWLWLCTLCQGVPVAVLSAWFAGGVPLLPFSFP